MAVALRKIEFIGGPWDGGFYLVLQHEERVTVEGMGGVCLDYRLDEIQTGNGVREVMRFVGHKPQQ